MTYTVYFPRINTFVTWRWPRARAETCRQFKITTSKKLCCVFIHLKPSSYGVNHIFFQLLLIRNWKELNIITVKNFTMSTERVSGHSVYIEKTRKRKAFREKRIRKTDSVWNVVSLGGRSWQIKKNTINIQHTEDVTECQLQGKNFSLRSRKSLCRT